MPSLKKIHLSPLRFVATDGTVRIDLKLEDAERVVSAVQACRGNIVGRVEGSHISLRLCRSTHRFLTNEHTSSVSWYATDDDLAALKWALIEAQQAAEFFS